MSKKFNDDPVLKANLINIENKGQSIRDALGITASVSNSITMNCPTCNDILIITKHMEESCICGDWELEDGKAKFILIPDRKKKVNN